MPSVLCIFFNQVYKTLQPKGF